MRPMETKLLDLSDRLNPQFIGRKSVLRWLINHSIELDQFLEERYSDPDDRFDEAKKIFSLEYPLQMMVNYLLVKDYMKTNIEKIQLVIDRIVSVGYVVMCVGKKGGGKTALMAWLSQMFHECEYEVYWLESNLKLPTWIRSATRLEEIHPESDRPVLVVADEASITANSRDAMSSYNKDLSKVLAIARHQNLRVIFCAQHLNVTDVNIYRFSDCWLTKQFQMTEVVEMQKQRQSVFYQYIRMMQPLRQEQTLFTDGNEWVMFENPLPPWWTDEISKGWSKLDEEQARKIIANAYIYDRDVDTRQLQMRLKARGVNLSQEEIEEIGLDSMAEHEESRKGRKKGKRKPGK